MKKHERRAAQQFPYYKLAAYDPISLTWRDGKKAYASMDDAIADAFDGQGGQRPGQFRVSEVRENGERIDLTPALGSPITLEDGEQTVVAGYLYGGEVHIAIDSAGRVHEFNSPLS